jgi:CheY-like chemotaxis protein
VEHVKASKEYESAHAELSMVNAKLSVPVNVLFVDDEVMLLQLGAHLMEESGCSVIVARDPLEAISIMSNTVEIEIAILDYHMPVMNGCALADRLRSMHPELKIILYSGAIDIPQSEMTNVDAFISKGDDARRLLSQVSEFARAGPLPRCVSS